MNIFLLAMLAALLVLVPPVQAAPAPSDSPDFTATLTCDEFKQQNQPRIDGIIKDAGDAYDQVVAIQGQVEDYYMREKDEKDLKVADYDATVKRLNVLAEVTKQSLDRMKKAGSGLDCQTDSSKSPPPTLSFRASVEESSKNLRDLRRQVRAYVIAVRTAAVAAAQPTPTPTPSSPAGLP